MNHRLLALLTAALVLSIPITFAAELRLTYDANGNLVTGDGKYRVYNSLNQLSAVYNGSDTAGALLETYVHHTTEERILQKKTYNPDGSVKETTYYISQTFVRIVNDSGAFDATYVYHNGALVAQNINGSVLYVAPDPKGTTSVVTNANGTILERDEYSPYGSPLNNSVVRYGYEGKEADSLVGDTDFHARKYRPDLGIFSSPDALLPNVYDPQQLNRYSFERNSPYGHTDPTGHDSGGPGLPWHPYAFGAFVSNELRLFHEYNQLGDEAQSNGLDGTTYYTEADEHVSNVLNHGLNVLFGGFSTKVDGMGSFLKIANPSPDETDDVTAEEQYYYTLQLKYQHDSTTLQNALAAKALLTSLLYNQAQSTNLQQGSTSATTTKKISTDSGGSSGGGRSTIIGRYSLSTRVGTVTVKILSQSSYASVRAMVSSSKSASSGKH